MRIAHAIPASDPEPPVQNLCWRVRQSSPAQGKPVAVVIWSMTILLQATYSLHVFRDGRHRRSRIAGSSLPVNLCRR